MAELASLYHLAVLIGLLLALLILAANLYCFGGLQEVRPNAEAPLVSILVPAGRDLGDLERCIRSLLAQNHLFFEVLVLIDAADDDSARALRGHGVSETGSVSRLIRGHPVPEGWTPKNWAYHQLGREARGEYLLFTDADAEYEQGMVSALVGLAQRQQADLISAWPQQRTITLAEKLAVPTILLSALTVHPQWLLSLLQRFPRIARRISPRYLRELGAANGQCLLLRRVAYYRIGGHEEVRSHAAGGMALGRAVAAQTADGMRLLNCTAAHLVHARAYRSLREIWRGVPRSISSALDGSRAAFLSIAIFQLCCFGLPFLWLFFPGGQRPLVVAQIILVLLMSAMLAWRFHMTWLGVLLHPVAFAFTVAAASRSWWFGADGWRRARRGVHASARA